MSKCKNFYNMLYVLCLCCLLGAQDMQKRDALLTAPVAGDHTNKSAVDQTRGKLVIDAALAQAVPALKSAPFSGKGVAILPLKDQRPGTLSGENNNYLISRLTNILVECGHSVVVAKEDEAWEVIASQIEFSERKSDILDSSSIVKFGNQCGAEILIYGSIGNVLSYDTHTYTEITLYAVDVQSAKHIWGGVFSGRAYSGKDIEGILSLDQDFRELIKELFWQASKSLTNVVSQQKLANVKTIAVLPINGDIDQYSSQMVHDMLAGFAQWNSCTPSIPTLEMTCRMYGFEGNQKADAVFYGSLRDLSVKNNDTIEDKENFQRIFSQTKRVEMQFSILDVKTRNVLWSATFSSNKVVNEMPKDMSEKEIKEIIEKEQNTFWYILTHPFCNAAIVFWKIFGLVILAVFVLVIIRVFIRGLVMIFKRR